MYEDFYNPIFEGEKQLLNMVCLKKILVVLENKI